MQREAEMGVRQPQDKDHQGGQWPPESKHRKHRVHSPSQPANTLTSVKVSCEKTHSVVLNLPPHPRNLLAIQYSIHRNGEA